MRHLTDGGGGCSVSVLFQFILVLVIPSNEFMEFKLEIIRVIDLTS